MTKETTRFLETAGTSPALWITPPRWTEDAPSIKPVLPFSLPLIRLQSIVQPWLKGNNTFYIQYRHNGCEHAGKESPWRWGRKAMLGPVWRLERREDNTVLKPGDNEVVSNEEAARRELCLLAPSLCHLRLENTSTTPHWPRWLKQFSSYRAFDGVVACQLQQCDAVCRH